jgi:ProP effector
MAPAQARPPAPPRPAQAEQRPDPAEQQARWERARLLRDFDSTRLTTANFCVLKGVDPTKLDALLAQARKEAAEFPPMPFADRRGPPNDRRPPGDRNDRPRGPQDARGGPRGDRPPQGPRGDRPPQGPGGDRRPQGDRPPRREGQGQGRPPRGGKTG